MHPNAKFVFLFRNPVSIISSMVETWGKGSLIKLFSVDIDLKQGFRALSEGYKLLKDRAFVLNYENLIGQPEKELQNLCHYLDIEFDEKMVHSFAEEDLRGEMGDPVGVKAYRSIKRNSDDKWKKTFNTSYRKRLLKKYINNIEEEVLEVQGYDKNEILNNIDNLKIEGIAPVRTIKDIINYNLSSLARVIKPNIWLEKETRNWAAKKLVS